MCQYEEMKEGVLEGLLEKIWLKVFLLRLIGLGKWLGSRQILQGVHQRKLGGQLSQIRKKIKI